MNPGVADFDAFPAHPRARRLHVFDLIQVRALFHVLTLYSSAKARWTRWMAMAPSPTAEATRFTLPERTSPTANTPGRLVSSIWGGRASVHSADPDAESSSRPVTMNPLASRARQPRSHSVRGDAPAMMNTWWMSWTEVSRLGLSRQVTRSKCVPPSRAVIS